MIARIKKVGIQLMLICMLTVLMPLHCITALAADGKITFSDLSATVGEEISVRVKIAAASGQIARSELILSYDPDVLEFIEGSDAQGGAGTIRLKGTAGQSETQVYTLKFKTLTAGDTKITVNSQEVYDANEAIMNITHTGSSAIKVGTSAASSDDATLQSLKVSPGSLTPAFSPDVTNYSVEVGMDTAKLIVDAKANHSGAKTSVSGLDLTETENTVICKVTAEDGQTVKEYSISVKKVEGGETVSPDETIEAPSYVSGDMSATVNGVTYEVAKQFDESTLPEGFEAVNYTYHDTEVRAGKGLQKDITLLYLKDEQGNGGLFMYNEQKDSFSPWVEISVSAKSIAILPMDESLEIPEGFVEASVDVAISEDQKRTVQGWVWESDEEHQYCVFYGMNWNGETGLYRYDFKEMTIQRYFQDPAVDTGISREIYDMAVDSYNSLVADYNIRMAVIIGLIVAVILLLAAVIALAMKVNANKNKPTPPSGSKEADFQERKNPTVKTVKREEEQYTEHIKDQKEAYMDDSDQEVWNDQQDDGDDLEPLDLENGESEDESLVYGMEKNLEGELARDITEMRKMMDEDDLEAVDLESVEEIDDDQEDDFDLIDLDE